MRPATLSLAILFLAGCGSASDGEDRPRTRQDRAGERTMGFTMTSPSFGEGQEIPAVFTCDGKDRSPALGWSGAPEGTVSFALICDDPDAPGGDWVHWVVFDLPPEITGLPEGVPSSDRLEPGGVSGKNSWGRIGYGGPCPPGGTHRYFFKLYALDRRLELGPGASKREVLEAAEGHILAQAGLMGRYRRR